MRSVVDANVLISALLSSESTPARVLRALAEGEFELIASPRSLAELKRALAYPKLRKRIPDASAEEFLSWLESVATIVPDPEDGPSVRSEDPGDDYLIALAQGERAALVSGDGHLLALRDRIPVFSPADFLAMRERRA